MSIPAWEKCGECGHCKGLHGGSERRSDTECRSCYRANGRLFACYCKEFIATGKFLKSEDIRIGGIRK